MEIGEKKKSSQSTWRLIHRLTGSFWFFKEEKLKLFKVCQRDER